MIECITPEELRKTKTTSIPESVIKDFNEKIRENWNPYENCIKFTVVELAFANFDLRYSSKEICDKVGKMICDEYIKKNWVASYKLLTQNRYFGDYEGEVKSNYFEFAFGFFENEAY